MARRYTKVEEYTEEVFSRKAAGETNRQIAESLGLDTKQLKNLVARQNRKQRAIINGYVPRPKGRPRKDSLEETEESKREKELAKLRMENELLRNFLCEVGRR